MHAKKVIAKNGRWAILARHDENASWVQVESVYGDDAVEQTLSELENKEYRDEMISLFEDEEWGCDAPKGGQA